MLLSLPGGEDTRKNFVGHLYEALEAKRIETYKDDENIEKGERISDQLNYSNPLKNELVKIMECQKTQLSRLLILSFLMWSLHKSENKLGQLEKLFLNMKNHEAAGKWRDAMKELANLAGWELKATANG
ncbi:Toll/interleukin-1 receptor domain-containing protein, partial [Tanacetum coccineum]